MSGKSDAFLSWAVYLDQLYLHSTLFDSDYLIITPTILFPLYRGGAKLPMQTQRARVRNFHLLTRMQPWVIHWDLHKALIQPLILLTFHSAPWIFHTQKHPCKLGPAHCRILLVVETRGGISHQKRIRREVRVLFGPDNRERCTLSILQKSCYDL